MKLRPALLLVAATLPFAGCGPGDQATASLYRANCARCHGMDGKGDPHSVQLDPHLDLTHSAMIQREERSAIGNRISEGYQAMPGFSHKLEREDVEALIDYTRRFKPGKAGG